MSVVPTSVAPSHGATVIGRPSLGCSTLTPIEVGNLEAGKTRWLPFSGRILAAPPTSARSSSAHAPVHAARERGRDTATERPALRGSSRTATTAPVPPAAKAPAEAPTPSEATDDIPED